MWYPHLLPGAVTGAVLQSEPAVRVEDQPHVQRYVPLPLPRHLKKALSPALSRDTVSLGWGREVAECNNILCLCVLCAEGSRCVAVKGKGQTRECMLNTRSESERNYHLIVVIYGLFMSKRRVISEGFCFYLTYFDVFLSQP